MQFIIFKALLLEFKNEFCTFIFKIAKCLYVLLKFNFIVYFTRKLDIMVLRLSIFICIACVTYPLSSEAQLVRRLRNAAEEGVARAVERRVAGEVEKATQKQLEKAFGDLYAGSNPGGTPYDFSKILESINLDVETEDSYSFTGVADMEVTSTDHRGKAENPMLIKSYLSGDEQFSAMEFVDGDKQKSKEKTIMIFDFKNNATILLAEKDGERSRMAFGSDWHSTLDNLAETGQDDEKNDPYDLENMTFEKTGKTKTILGYLCDEFTAKNDEMEASYWISREPIEGLQTFWGKNSPFLSERMKAENKMAFNQFPEGSLMEMHFVSTSDKSSSQFKMVNIDANESNTFDMAAYPNVFTQQ